MLLLLIKQILCTEPMLAEESKEKNNWNDKKKHKAKNKTSRQAWAKSNDNKIK